MKKFKLIVPSFVALIFCMLLIAGSTFALFTSQASAEISVTSGKVKISAELTELQLYSAKAVELAEYNTNQDKAGQIAEGNYAGNYVFEEQETTFANGGTAVVSSAKDSLTIERMTPGDKVTLNLKVSNDSNVNIKYRVRFEASFAKSSTEEYTKALASAMKVSVGDTVKNGLVKYQSEWTELLAGATVEQPEALALSFELPLEMGNDYQEGGVKYSFTIEAVQGNAATSGAELFDTIDLYIPERTNSVVATSTEALTVSVKENETDSSNLVEVTVPASILSEDDVVELKVSDLTVSKSESDAEATVGMTIDLKINDVLVDSVNHFEEAITAKIFVGTGLNELTVKHGEGADETTFVRVNNISDLAADKFYYDSESGFITLKTMHFSPFRIEGDFVAAVTVADAAPLLCGTIHDAFTAANTAALTKNVTIDMFKDVEISAKLEAFRSMTINGNGHKITAKTTGPSRMLWIDEDNTVITINDLTFDGAQKAERGIQINTGLENCGYVLENVSVINMTYYAINYCQSLVNPTLTMNNCYVQGWGAVNLWSEEYNVTINNSTLIGLNDKSYNAEGWNDFGTIILEGDTTGETETHSANVHVVINNTKIIAQSLTGNLQYCVLFNEPSAYNVVELTNCTMVYDLEEGGRPYLIQGSNNSFLIDGEQQNQFYIVGGGESMIDSGDEN